jgi:hypothetical protein
MANLKEVQELKLEDLTIGKGASASLDFWSRLSSRPPTSRASSKS